jgi:hypothetical protein
MLAPRPAVHIIRFGGAHRFPRFSINAHAARASMHFVAAMIARRRGTHHLKPSRLKSAEAQ